MRFGRQMARIDDRRGRFPAGRLDHDWPDREGSLCSRARILVESNHAGAAQTQIMLETQARALDLPFPRAATQLVGQFETLCQAGGAEWVAFRQQAAGQIGRAHV